MTTPVKFNEAAQEEYLTLIRAGHGRHWSARHVGIGPRTVQRLVKADREFAAAVALAEEEASEPVEAKLYEQAEAGEPWAVKMWLERRMQARWGAVPSVVKVEGEVTHEVGPGLARVAQLAAQLEERRAALEEAGVSAPVLDVASWEAGDAEGPPPNGDGGPGDAAPGEGEPAFYEAVESSETGGGS